jgi:hypothetical protein
LPISLFGSNLENVLLLFSSTSKTDKSSHTPANRLDHRTIPVKVVIELDRMENVTDPSLQNIPVSLRNLQSGAAAAAAAAYQHHPHPHPHPQTQAHPLATSLGAEYDTPGYQPYDLNDVQQHVNNQVQAFQQPHQSLQASIRYPEGSFGPVTPNRQQQQQLVEQNAVSFPIGQANTPDKETGGHFGGMRVVPNPPDLQQWREKLFNVDEMITLTEDESVS